MLPTTAAHGDTPAPPLWIPEIPPDTDNLTAAMAYANAGWYVLPVKRRTKSPGSVVGKHWQRKSSRDPQQLAAWFAGTDHGIALHCGRSGAVVFDVDRPEAAPEILRRHLIGAPYQSTRPDSPRRGHYVFAMPFGRTLGNGTGKLSGAWGDVRGANGVIVVEPTPHPDGGEYRWQQRGPVPPLPDGLATLLSDASPAEDAASDAVVAAFLAEHVGGQRLDLLDALTGSLAEKVSAGASRHDSTVSVMAGAMKEACAGLYPAQLAADRIAALFVPAMAVKPTPERRKLPDAQALSELNGMLAWSVGQALAADPAETQRRVAEKVPAAKVDEVSAESLIKGTALPVVKMTRLADVVPERTEWLWRGYLPLGKQVTLDGDPNLGKSTLSLEFSATVTTGGTWPDGSVCEHPGAVVICSAEDGLADTIRPRLDAAGADVSRVHSVDGVPVHSDGTLRPPTLADIAALEHAIITTGARLLVIDVVMAYLPTGTDAHKDQDIRRVLSALSRLAERTRCTVLLLRHLNKGSGRDPLYRGGGSIGIVGAARAGLLVAADPEDPQRRVLASIKSNLAPAPQSLSYRLLPAVDNPAVARVSWEGVTELTAAALLAGSQGDGGGASQHAERWLRAYLSTRGETESGTVKAAADAADPPIRERTLHRARTAIGAQALSRPTDTGRVTVWRLPEADSRRANGYQPDDAWHDGTTPSQQREHGRANGMTPGSCHDRETGTNPRPPLHAVPDPAPSAAINGHPAAPGFAALTSADLDMHGQPLPWVSMPSDNHNHREEPQ